MTTACIQRILSLSNVLVLSCLSGTAIDSDYGCKVLLCLANPAGPTALSQCVPPIIQLWRDLASFHPFPTCNEEKPAVAVQETSLYDACPDGTTALHANSQTALPGSDAYAVGIGSGDGLSSSMNSDGSSIQKVCVGKLLSSVTVGGSSTGDSGGGGDPVVIGTYDRVVLLDPAWSPRVIDVYINGALYRRVRW